MLLFCVIFLAGHVILGLSTALSNPPRAPQSTISPEFLVNGVHCHSGNKPMTSNWTSPAVLHIDVAWEGDSLDTDSLNGALFMVCDVLSKKPQDEQVMDSVRPGRAIFPGQLYGDVCIQGFMHWPWFTLDVRWIDLVQVVGLIEDVYDSSTGLPRSASIKASMNSEVMATFDIVHYQPLRSQSVAFGSHNEEKSPPQNLTLIHVD